jgi:hypothetical protein
MGSRGFGLEKSGERSKATRASSIQSLLIVFFFNIIPRFIHTPNGN